MSGDTIYACLIVDDVPLNATYWARKQQTAFGYKPKETGAWGENWRVQEAAPFFPLRLAHEFADFVEEFDVRGKFTFLPCPGGLGRIDRSVRGYPDGELSELVTLVRERLMRRFDITPEVLTHSMAYSFLSRWKTGRTVLLPSLRLDGSEKCRNQSPRHHAWRHA